MSLHSRDIPFHQPQQLHCLRHGSTEAQLCSSLHSIPFSTAGLVTICIMALVQDLGKCNTSRGASYIHYSLLGILTKMFKELKAK